MAAGLPPSPPLDSSLAPGQSGLRDDLEVAYATLNMLDEAAGMTVAEIAADPAFSVAFQARRSALYDAYSGKGTAPLGNADSGQAWYVYPASGDDEMTVVADKLSNIDVTGGTAGYAQVDLGDPITRIGSVCTFGPHSTGNGVWCLAIWKTLHTGGAVPDSNLHFVLGVEVWELGTWEGNVFTSRASGWLAEPLTADGTTEHYVDCTIIGDTVYITLPDGTIASDTHADYADTPGTIASFETFALASTDAKASATEVWADTGAEDHWTAVVSPGALAKALAPLAPIGLIKPQAKLYAPGSRQTLTLTTSQQEISTALRQTFIYPESGEVQVDLAFYGAINGWVIVAVAAAADLVTGVANVSVIGGDGGSQAFRGQMHARLFYGGTPGTSTTLYFGAAAPVGAGDIISDAPYGYFALSTVTPLA